MCKMNDHLVSEYNSPCSNCPEYLSTGRPIIVGGYLFGECDIYYCEYCKFYDECTEEVGEP